MHCPCNLHLQFRLWLQIDSRCSQCNWCRTSIGGHKALLSVLQCKCFDSGYMPLCWAWTDWSYIVLWPVTGKPTLQFLQAGVPVTLHGIQSVTLATLQAISVEQVNNALVGNDIWAMLVISQETPDSPVHISPLEPDMEQLLTEYVDVFAEPKTLTPHRLYDQPLTLEPVHHPPKLSPLSLLTTTKGWNRTSSGRDDRSRHCQPQYESLCITCAPFEAGGQLEIA